MKLLLLALLAGTLALPLSASAGEIVKRKWYDSDGKLVEQYVYSGKQSKRAYQRASRQRRYPAYRGTGYTYPLRYRF